MRRPSNRRAVDEDVGIDQISVSPRHLPASQSLRQSDRPGMRSIAQRHVGTSLMQPAANSVR